MLYSFYLMLIVGIGGAFGSIMRFAAGNWVQQLFEMPTYPLATTFVNIIGCFFIGIISSLAESRIALSGEMRIFLQIGVLGGFTTFSSFGYETFSLIHGGEFFLAIANVLVQITLGFSAVWLGYYLGQ